MNSRYYIIVIIAIVLGIAVYTIYKSKTSIQSDTGNISPSTTPTSTQTPTLMPSTPTPTQEPASTPSPEYTPASTQAPSNTPFFPTRPTPTTMAPTAAPTTAAPTTAAPTTAAPTTAAPTTAAPTTAAPTTAAPTTATPTTSAAAPTTAAPTTAAPTTAAPTTAAPTTAVPTVAAPSASVNIISVMSAAANGVDKYYACTTGGSIWTITNTHPSKAGSIEINITKRPGVSFSSGGIVYDSTKKFDIPVGGSVTVIWNLTLNDGFSIRFGNFDGSDVLYSILTKNGNMYVDPYAPSNSVTDISLYYKIKGFYSLASVPVPTTMAPTAAPTTPAPTTAPLTDPNFTQIVKDVPIKWPNSTISFKNISNKQIYVIWVKLDCTVPGLPPPPGFSNDYSLRVYRYIAPGASVSFKMPPVLNPGITLPGYGTPNYVFSGIFATLADGTDYLLTANYPPTNDGYISFKEVPAGQDFIFQYQP
jgi:hypothetical protein